MSDTDAIRGPDLQGAASSLERYRSLIADGGGGGVGEGAGEWSAFLDALARPLPTTVWTNTLRVAPERLRELLAAEGLGPEPLRWCPGAFRLGGSGPASVPTPGRGLLAATGSYHIQEEVSLLPVELLDPRPGERVLDLCAAPGGKTARIAVAMENRGTVVANDVDWRRLAAVGRNLDRLGLTNVATTAWDAANFPEGGGRYDRVLADVPCTCEGTSRKNPGVLTWGGQAERRRTVAVQTAILRKAVRLCRPGGRVVYSTCTYAPEENEAVVAAVLREARQVRGADALRLAEARLEGFRAAPGLVAWDGETFGPEMARALRVWPHVEDTGGFFVAVLEVGDGPGRDDGPTPDRIHSFEEVDRERWLGPVIERFGFPDELFAGVRPVRHGGKTLALVADELAPPAHPEPRSYGLAFLHVAMRDPKMTTPAAMAYGHRARRNVVDLDRSLDRELDRDSDRELDRETASERGRARATEYLARCDLELGADEAEAMTGPGYALVRWAGLCLGVGWFRPAPGGGGSLRSLFPKRWSS